MRPSAHHAELVTIAPIMPCRLLLLALMATTMTMMFKPCGATCALRVTLATQVTIIQCLATRDITQSVLKQCAQGVSWVISALSSIRLPLK